MAVEPTGTAVLSGGTAGQHRIPGIGVGFVPNDTCADQPGLDPIHNFMAARAQGRPLKIRRLASRRSGRAANVMRNDRSD